MENFMLTIPVVFIVFNRLDTAKMVFETIKKVKPFKLYIISDGARELVIGETEKVEKVRTYVENHIDWDCQIVKVYAETNMGCKNRVASGISRVFEQEEMAIILEDDCVPSDEFYFFMEQMLHIYKDNEEIMMISGNNRIKKYKKKKPYYFSYFSSIWGWGTWKRAWKLYDIDVKRWGSKEGRKRVKEKFSLLTYLFVRRNIEKVYRHEKDTWDYQWEFARLVNNGLGIVPSGNLVNNIGFAREDATHTRGQSHIDFSYDKMEVPVPVRDKIMHDEEYDKEYQKKIFGSRKILHFVKGKFLMK